MSRNAGPGHFFGKIGFAVGLAVGSSIAPPAAAQDYYAGKTINFIVGTDTSGGFNIYARLIAPHLRRHIPGNPTVIVRNMPGAGGATAAAHMFQQAPKDGTTIAALTPSAISARLLQGPAQNVADPTKFTYLAGAERGTRVCYTWHTSPTRTLADALARKTVIGTTASGSPTTDYAAAIKHTTGAQFHIAGGYKGVNDLNLAMERGEVDGICGLDWSALKVQQGDWVKAGKLNILVQATIEPVPELAGMGVPLPWGFIKDPIDRRAFELMVGFQQAFGKAYLAPPDVAPERIAELRRAFAAALRDPELLAEATKAGVEIVPTSGAAVEKVVKDLYAASPDVVDRLKRITVP